MSKFAVKDFTKKFGWVNFTVLNPLEIRPK